MLFTNRLNAIQDQVNAYLEQIARLQAQVTSLQTHAQEVQGAEQAAESALAQIETALSMLSAICPDEIATFKAAIDAKFGQSLPQLNAGDGDADAAVTPPDAPVDTTAIIVTAVTIDDHPLETEAVKADDPDEIVTPERQILSLKELLALKRPHLIKLYGAAYPGSNGKSRNMTVVELANALNGKVFDNDSV